MFSSNLSLFEISFAADYSLSSSYRNLFSLFRGIFVSLVNFLIYTIFHHRWVCDISALLSFLVQDILISFCFVFIHISMYCIFIFIICLLFYLFIIYTCFSLIIGIFVAIIKFLIYTIIHCSWGCDIL